MDKNTHKKCCDCNETFPLSEFAWANKKKGWRSAKCNRCFRLYQRKRYQSNPVERAKQSNRMKGYYEENKEHIKQTSKHRYEIQRKSMRNIDIPAEYMPVRGFPKYYLTPDNEIVSNKTWGILRTLRSHIDRDGYKIYTLYKDKKGHVVKLHRIVYESYHNKDIPKGLVIDHIDNNLHNNDIHNLQLLTLSLNSTKYQDYARLEREARKRQLDSNYYKNNK